MCPLPKSNKGTIFKCFKQSYIIKTYVLRRKSTYNVETGSGKRLDTTGVAGPVRKSRRGRGGGERAWRKVEVVEIEKTGWIQEIVRK